MALWAGRLLLAHDQGFKLVIALFAGVFENRHKDSGLSNFQQDTRET